MMPVCNVGDVDISDFIANQRRKIDSQKHHYWDLINNLSEWNLNIDTLDNTGDINNKIDSEDCKLLQLKVEQSAEKTKLSPVFKNNHTSSQILISGNNNFYNSTTSPNMERFIPGIGFNEGRNHDAERLRKEIYRRQLDRQVEENQRFKEQKETKEKNLVKSDAKSNVLFSNWQCTSPDKNKLGRRHYHQKSQENHFEDSSEPNEILFSNSQSESSKLGRSSCKQEEIEDNGNKESSNILVSIGHPELQNQTSFGRHRYQVSSVLDFSQEMDNGKERQNINSRGSKSPVNTDLNEPGVYETVRSFLTHGGESCKVSQNDLQKYRRLNQQEYRMQLENQIKEKNKMINDEKEKIRKEDEKIDEYIAAHAVKFANGHEENSAKNKQSDRRQTSANLIRNNNNNVRDEEKENWTTLQSYNADDSRSALKRFQEEKLLENLSSTGNNKSDDRNEKQNVTVNYPVSRRRDTKNYVITKTTDSNFSSTLEQRTKTLPKRLDSHRSTILIDAPHKLSILGSDTGNLNNDYDVQDDNSASKELKCPPSPIISAVRTRNLLENMFHLKQAIPPSVSLSDNARNEYEKHILANLTEVRRRLMQNTKPL